jgi:hypothetical protein
MNDYQKYHYKILNQSLLLAKLKGSIALSIGKKNIIWKHRK